VKRKTIFSMAWENMKHRKLRTTLTTLGVVIGVMAIIALASLGEGFRATVTSQIEQFELDVIMVMPGGAITRSGMMYLTRDDANNISQIEGVSVATPVMQKMGVTLYNGDKNASTLALGVNFTDFQKVYPNRLVFEHGGLPQPVKNDTIVLGYRVAHAKTGENFASIGDEITMKVNVGAWPPIWKNYTFTVAGILAESGGGTLVSVDNVILIPLETAEEIYKTDYDIIFVKLADRNLAERVAKDIREMFQNQVLALAPSIMIQRAGNILDTVQIFLAAVSSIALLVAGIGIMNIMTVSVMERTREIGILKAVGAKSRSVLVMFLAEAALIGVVGGLVGIPAGYGLAYVLSSGLSTIRAQPETNPALSLLEGTSLTITPVFSLTWTVSAVIFGIVVSVLFGWYPARKAAKMNPVQALRYE